MPDGNAGPRRIGVAGDHAPGHGGGAGGQGAVAGGIGGARHRPASRVLGGEPLHQPAARDPRGGVAVRVGRPRNPRRCDRLRACPAPSHRAVGGGEDGRGDRLAAPVRGGWLCRPEPGLELDWREEDGDWIPTLVRRRRGLRADRASRRRLDGRISRMAPRPRSIDVQLPPFQTLVDAHASELHRFLVASIGAMDAEDCLQETLISALRAYPRLRDASNLRAWLYTIAQNKATDVLRRRARHRADRLRRHGRRSRRRRRTTRPTRRCGRGSGPARQTACGRRPSLRLRPGVRGDRRADRVLGRGGQAERGGRIEAAATGGDR